MSGWIGRETRRCPFDRDHCGHAWPSTWRSYWCPGVHRPAISPDVVPRRDTA